MGLLKDDYDVVGLFPFNQAAWVTSEDPIKGRRETLLEFRPYCFARAIGRGGVVARMNHEHGLAGHFAHFATERDGSLYLEETDRGLLVCARVPEWLDGDLEIYERQDLVNGISPGWHPRSMKTEVLGPNHQAVTDIGRLDEISLMVGSSQQPAFVGSVALYVGRCHHCSQPLGINMWMARCFARTGQAPETRCGSCAEALRMGRAQ